jgi:hypothetical protein
MPADEIMYRAQSRRNPSLDTQIIFRCDQKNPESPFEDAEYAFDDIAC